MVRVVGDNINVNMLLVSRHRLIRIKSKTQTKKKNVKNKDSLSLKKIKNLNKALTESLKESENKNLRLMAEFDNLKKRTQRTIIDSYNRNLENVILSFLPIIDDFDRMIDNENNDKTMKEGVSIIQSKFKKILDSYDVDAFNSKGELFDADLHEAIMAQHCNKKANIIIDEFEKGYKIKDKVIRHAKVIVSKGKE